MTCTWPIDQSCLAADWADFSPSVKERAAALASATLTRLTGYRVTNCPITVRPCKAGCVGDFARPYLTMQGSGAGWTPFINDGAWVNSCGCTANCSCGPLCSVALPGPVGRVDRVMLDGVEVPDTDWRAISTGVLWVGTSECPWPTCQDLAKPDTEPGTFSITYVNGYPPDLLGAGAAATLANEFAKACCGTKCRLPAGVTAVARQGISLEIASGVFPGGMTGIREVDAYLALWNPEGLRQSSQVWSPDLRRAAAW